MPVVRSNSWTPNLTMSTATGKWASHRGERHWIYQSSHCSNHSCAIRQHVLRSCYGCPNNDQTGCFPTNISVSSVSSLFCLLTIGTFLVVDWLSLVIYSWYTCYIGLWYTCYWLQKHWIPSSCSSPGCPWPAGRWWKQHGHRRPAAPRSCGWCWYLPPDPSCEF